MAADLYRIVQRMDKQLPNRRETPTRFWLLLALWLVLLSALIGGFSAGH